MLAPDVRLEGFTAEDWMRLVSLFKTREAPSDTGGGLFVIHEDGVVRKALHTRRGRLERRGDLATWPALGEAERAKLFAAIAEAEHASFVVAAEVGALDEVMERFGARARREDDLVAQSLRLIEIVRELMNERRIEGWPRRLKNFPVPTHAMVTRAIDALCKHGHAIALGAFKDGELFTAIVVRRGERGFDLIGGPDELRPAMGLLSGDWRRDVRHLVAAIEDRWAPLAFGCFAEVDTLHQLQTDSRAGAWSRAAAVRDVVLSPMPLAIGVALGVDGARYAWDTVRSVVPLSALGAPLAMFEPAAAAIRKRIGEASDKDIASVLGFSPLEVLRALRKPHEPK
jgi:hypothetical protein